MVRWCYTGEIQTRIGGSKIKPMAKGKGWKKKKKKNTNQRPGYLTTLGKREWGGGKEIRQVFATKMSARWGRWEDSKREEGKNRGKKTPALGAG